MVVNVLIQQMLVELIEEISESFAFCKQVKPKASRMDSSELYILSHGFVKK